MNLYKISNEYRVVLDQIADAEGEAEDEVFLELDALGEAFEKKVEAVAMYIRELLAEAEGVKTEADRLAARARATKNKADRLKAYLQESMTATGKKKVDGDVLKIALQKSPPRCEVRFPELVDGEFRSVISEVKIDKKAIIARWKKDGKVTRGCEIFQGESLRIR